MQRTAIQVTPKKDVPTLVHSLKEIEVWLFAIAIYILWKKEKKYSEALALCSRVISMTSSHLNHITTLSPKSHIEKQENDDKKLSLNILISKLQVFESLIAHDCVQSYIGTENGSKDNDDGSNHHNHDINHSDKDDNDFVTSSFIQKQRMDSLTRRMEFNKQRLESLNARLDLKVNVINFSMTADVEKIGEDDTKTEEDTSSGPSSIEDSSSRKVTMSNVLYPHLVFHPYFNIK